MRDRNDYHVIRSSDGERVATSCFREKACQVAKSLGDGYYVYLTYDKIEIHHSAVTLFEELS